MSTKSSNSLCGGLCSAVSRRRQAAAGFTLIELLVAMGILMLIVLLLSNLFQQSTRAWDMGLRHTEVGLEARAAINILQQDLSMAFANSAYTFSAGGNALDFYVLDVDGEPQSIRYRHSGKRLSRNGIELVDRVEVFEVTAPAHASDEVPDRVDIVLEMSATSRIPDVRVYAQGREYSDSRTDWVDTDRGRGN